MITVVLILTLLLPGDKPKVQRIPVPSAEECVRRGMNMAQQAGVLPLGGKAIIACEFSKT